MTEQPKLAQLDSSKIIVRILIGSAILYAILQLGVTWLARQLDQTWAALIATVVMLCMALILERLFFQRSPRTALRGLGYGPWNPRAMFVAAITPSGHLLSCMSARTPSGWSIFPYPIT